MPVNPTSHQIGHSAQIVLILALLATGFGVWRERELARREQIIRWQAGYAQLFPVVQPYVFLHLMELYSAARSDLQRPHDFSEKAWVRFLADAEWRQKYPGMLAVGYADFNGEKAVVQYLDGEPVSSLVVPGADLAGTTNWREFVVQSAELNPALHNPVIIAGHPPAKVVLALLPLHKNEISPGTPAANRTNTQGFVFFLLDQQHYFEWIKTQMRPLSFDLQLLDPDLPAPVQTMTRRVLTTSGPFGNWQFVATLRPVPLNAAWSQWLVLAGGLALSGLLYFLVASQNRLRTDAEMARAETSTLNHDLEQRIAARTEELRLAFNREQELGRLKGNFVSMVSHELRTPLALILGSAEILSAYGDRLPLDKRSRHLQMIEDTVKSMALLVDDVLLFSRAEAGRLEFKPSAVALPALCQQLVEDVNSALHGRCPIQIHLPSPGEKLNVDENLIRHILMNLLTNAVKYSPPGCLVELRVEHVAGQVILTVRDHGIGIPAGDLAKIFKPFFRSENAQSVSGTGLGLVITRLCVDRHGGKIHVQSRENDGTTVTVWLPVYVPGETEFYPKPLTNCEPK